MTVPRPTYPPGSAEAVTAGCLCPVEHNARGVWPPPAGHWWITTDCPVHRHLLEEEPSR